MRGRARDELYIPAEVVKAARVWITVKPVDGPESWQSWRMRRDTQREDTQYSGSRTSFVTPEQAEYDERMLAVNQVIRDAKVTLENGYRDPDRMWTDARRAALADFIISLGILPVGGQDS